MPGLVPGIPIHAARRCSKNRDGRDKPGHDEPWVRADAYLNASTGSASLICASDSGAGMYLNFTASSMIPGSPDIRSGSMFGRVIYSGARAAIGFGSFDHSA